MATTRSTPGRKEMTALLALSMALAALGIDLMLPAFPAIRRSFDLAADSTAVAGLVTAYFFGLAIGQLVYGPLSDRYGRRPTLYGGYVIYAIGALAGAAAPSLTLLLVARVVWGFGASGPRVVTQAVIRDTYEGDAMARAMSLVMAVFLVVPVVAPTLGATIVHFGSWRWIFIGCVGFATLMSIWAVRLPETLRPEHRMELRFGRVASAAKLVVTDRQALTYTLAQTSLYGGFTAYIGSSQTIIDETFHRKAQFPLIFGGLGAMMGVAMLVNARVVSRFTARRVVHAVLFLFLANALAFVLIALATDGKPPIGVFIVLMAVVVSCHALLIPNSASIAMLPMAAVAGTAASIMGATQIAGGAILGSITDNAFDGTVRPLAFGFLGYGALAFGLVLWGERGRLFGTAAGADEPTASAVEVVV